MFYFKCIKYTGRQKISCVSCMSYITSTLYLSTFKHSRDKFFAKKNKCGPLKYMEFHLFARLKNVMFYDMALKHTGRTDPRPVKSETSENMSKVRQFEHSIRCWNCFYEEGSHLFQRIPRISDWDLVVSCSQPKILRRGLGWAMPTRTEHITNSGL